MHVHACWRDEECQSYGAPKRLYITTKHFGALIIGEKTQGWLPFLGSMPTKWPTWLTWWPIVYRPPRPHKPGWLYRNHPELFLTKRAPHTGRRFIEDDSNAFKEE